MAIDPITGLPSSNVQTVYAGDKPISSSPSPAPVISATKIGTTTASPVPSPVVPTINPTQATQMASYVDASSQTAEQQAAQQAQMEADAQKARGQAMMTDYAQSQALLGGKQGDLATAYNTKDETGNSVNSLAAQLRQLNAQAQGLQLDTLAKQQGEINKATGQNITQQAVARNTADATRENLINMATIGIKTAIAKADYDTAKSYADQMVDAKYSQMEANLKSKEIQFKWAMEQDLAPAQKKAADAYQRQLDAQKQEMLDKKAEKKEVKALSLDIAGKLASNGITGANASKIMDSITNAKSFNEAVIAAAPYMQSASDRADVSYKIAQTAKIYNDIKNEAANGGSNLDPAQTLAYAQQYASTGQIPTGIPKGSFGVIAQYAKETPKAKGTLVDVNTGVRPSKLGAEEEKGISATYDIVNNKLPILMEKFNKINTGIVGGILGNVYTTQDRQDFETTRGEILNLLLQARSGATVSPQEYERYSKLIPTSFNQPLFLGSDGSKKLNSLQKSLNDTLGSKLKTSGASIYGYSKVDINGKEYTVGDMVNAGGKTGRINPDGTVTLVQ